MTDHTAHIDASHDASAESAPLVDNTIFDHSHHTHGNEWALFVPHLGDTSSSSPQPPSYDTINALPFSNRPHRAIGNFGPDDVYLKVGVLLVVALFWYTVIYFANEAHKGYPGMK